MIRKGLLLLVFYLFAWTVNAQLAEVHILNADEQLHDEIAFPGIEKLIGNVHFEHDGAELFCDSAYYYKDSNIVQCMGHVFIIQGTFRAKANTLHYDGKSGLANLSGNVEMVDGTSSLITPRLDYNTNSKIASYQSGAVINYENTVIKSKRGAFDRDTKVFLLKENVSIKQTDFDLSADSLRFNNEQKRCYFISKTKIKTAGNLIFCESGWYENETGNSELRKNVRIIDSTGRIIQADTVINRATDSLLIAKGRFILTDTIQNMKVFADYARNNRKTDESKIWGRALLLQIDKVDTTWATADTIRMLTSADSAKNKSYLLDKRAIIYQDSSVMSADSILFSQQDSVVRFFKNPIIWTEGNQLTADTMWLDNRADSFRVLHLNQRAYLIKKVQGAYYDQMVGDRMDIKIQSNKISLVQVFGNGESLTHRTDSTVIQGVNRVTGARIDIYFKDGKASKIGFYENPKAKLIPISKAGVVYLDGFKLESEREKAARADMQALIDFYFNKGSVPVKTAPKSTSTTEKKSTSKKGKKRK